MRLNDIPQAYALRNRLLELREWKAITAEQVLAAIKAPTGELAQWWPATGPADIAKDANKWAASELAKVKAALAALDPQLAEELNVP
jgi:hypothetical protein